MIDKNSPAFPAIDGSTAFYEKGLTKREFIASQLDVKSDIADYSLEYLESLIGRERPSAPTTAEELLKWDAEVEAKIKIIKTDALLTQLSTPLP